MGCRLDAKVRTAPGSWDTGVEAGNAHTGRVGMPW